MKVIYRLSFLLLTVLIIILACSKDRLTVLPKTDLATVDFSSSDELTFDKWETLSDKRQIKTVSDLKFTTKSGVEISCSQNDFSYLDGTSIILPIEIEIKELLTPKAIILNRTPTVSDGRMLTTAGEIYFKATKDGKELQLNQYNRLKISVPINGIIDQGMWLFYGETNPNSPGVNWVQADTSRFQKVPPLSLPDNEKGKFYDIFPKQIGWINCDKFYNFTGPKTRISFSSEKPNLKFITTFLYFPDIKSIIQVYGIESLEVPVGQKVTVISIGSSTKGDIFTFIEEVEVKDKQTIKIELTDSTEKEFLAFLDSLKW